MARDFDEYVLWERDDPESQERARKVGENFLALADKAGDGTAFLEAVESLVDDMVVERLRSYHRWLGQA